MNVVASSSQVPTQLKASRRLQFSSQQRLVQISSVGSSSIASRRPRSVVSMALSATSPTAVETRRVMFRGPGGESLIGNHTMPGARHAVLLQHGYASNKDGFHLERIAKTLAEGGVGSLR